jgi:hypothetical protein
VIFFIGLFFNDFFYSLLTRFGMCEKQKEDEVDEKLGNYFECLTPLQRKIWFYEDQNLRKIMGISALD